MSSNIVSSTAWVKRGVAKAKPDRVILDDREALSVVAEFPNNEEDPMITDPIGDDDSDAEDLNIQETDNLVAALKYEQDESALVCYLYNHDEKDWYVHHHYDLPAPALHVERILHDPGTDDRKGNLVAVGSLEGDITIWDLDIIDLAEAVVTLGAAETGMMLGLDGTKKTADGSSHTAAVLSMAWNELMPHVLVSGGADSNLLLWDLEKAEVSTSVGRFKGLAQSVGWHPTDASVLLVGSMTGVVSAIDCRTMKGELRAIWNFGKEAEINKVKWDTYNNTCAYVACEDGYIRYVDCRVPGKPIYAVKAYENPVESLSLNYAVKDLIATCSGDCLSIWRNDPNGCTLVHNEKLDLGTLHTVEFCPDVPSVLVAGGELNDLIKPVDISIFSGLKGVFE
ncbi:hypothetical protein QR680_006269 [Steinernema hermaphroditum]|uniref:Uncharacterized protein n=1 Tax=Steinernema hermaphroditum TaxID=289476 RepID=A0AA39HUZ0_9BILA|nr:hypothetical protein QR680_006269 [Steinernema hermaphroditum]